MIRKFKTPGGRLSVQYLNKRVNRLKCAETGQYLNQIPIVALLENKELLLDHMEEF